MEATATAAACCTTGVGLLSQYSFTAIDTELPLAKTTMKAPTNDATEPNKVSTIPNREHAAKEPYFLADI